MRGRRGPHERVRIKAEQPHSKSRISEVMFRRKGKTPKFVEPGKPSASDLVGILRQRDRRITPENMTMQWRQQPQ
jgi:hypothetical protein